MNIESRLTASMKKATNTPGLQTNTDNHYGLLMVMCCPNVRDSQTDCDMDTTKSGSLNIPATSDFYESEVGMQFLNKRI